jgi:hypothetical protein
VLKELFNYASYALCSKDPVSFLKSGLDSVFHFVRTGLGVEFVNDSEVVCTCLVSFTSWMFRRVNLVTGACKFVYTAKSRAPGPVIILRDPNDKFFRGSGEVGLVGPKQITRHLYS